MAYGTFPFLPPLAVWAPWMARKHESSSRRWRGLLHAPAERALHQLARVATGGHILARCSSACAAAAHQHQRRSRLSHGVCIVAAFILMLGAQPLAAQPLGAIVSDESCSENASSTLTPRPRRPDLRYVTFDTADVTDAGSGRVARLARGILLPAEVRTLAEAVLSFKPDPKHLDSTDGLPAYEMYIRHKGVDMHPAAASTLPPIEARFGAFLAEHYSCEGCHLCSVLLRRYQAAERVQVKTHFDRMAFVTAVASLNPSEFDGGLFLQRTPRVDSREYFATEATDVAFHSYDLEHGEALLEGRAG